MDGPESVLWERLCAETVLVAHHHELEVGMLADETEVAEHALRELQFLEGIYLLIGRLFDKRTVAVDE